LKEAIRRHIVEKARLLFETRGFRATTVEDIAAAAGMSKPTLYNYFPGKEVLLLHVVEQMNTEFDEAIDPIIRCDKPFEERLFDIVSASLTYFREHRGIIRLAMFEYRVLIQAMIDKNHGPASFLKIRDARIRKLEEFFRDGLASSELESRLHPRFLGRCLLGILSEYYLAYAGERKDGSEHDVNRLSTDIVNVLLHGIVHKDGPHKMSADQTTQSDWRS